MSSSRRYFNVSYHTKTSFEFHQLASGGLCHGQGEQLIDRKNGGYL
jgi:hypothetical protein